MALKKQGRTVWAIDTDLPLFPMPKPRIDRSGNHPADPTLIGGADLIVFALYRVTMISVD
jgi:hypothetical protein